MKYILILALALGFLANASAQQGPSVKVIRAAYKPNTESNMQMLLDKLQFETENTVVYPLVRMTNNAFAKAKSMKHHKHVKRERIRTNNSPKRVMNPNRA